MLGAIAALAVGSFFAAPAAHAQALQTAVNGGVTCKQYSTGYASYPLTYWDCVDTGSSPTSYESVVGQAARTLPSSITGTLSNVELMIFANRTDFASFTGAAAPSSKYVAWTAPSAPPAQLAGKRIAAAFATANLYSPSDHVVASRNIEAYYKVHILQALGRQYDQLTGNPSAHVNPPAAAHIFPIAVSYDQYWANDVSAGGTSVVWDAQIAALYPGSTPWAVLGALYGNTSADLYAFQFATELGSNWSHLQQFLNSYALQTKGFRYQQVFGHGPINALKAVYSPSLARGVFCAKYTTTYSAPAEYIWDCVHPYQATAGEKTAGQGVGNLPVSFRNSLNTLNPRVELHVMRDYTDYNLMFNRNAPAGLLGISSQSGHWAVAFRHTLTDFAGLVENYYGGTLVHEVGHLMDEQFWGTYSSSAAWKAIVDADKIKFNQISSCMLALNDTEACSTDPLSEFAAFGNDWWARFMHKMDIDFDDPADPNPNEISDRLYREMFTFMFQKRSGVATIPFMQYFEGKIWTLSSPGMKNKMDSIWSTGAP